jgi:hypothetical protein
MDSPKNEFVLIFKEDRYWISKYAGGGSYKIAEDLSHNGFESKADAYMFLAYYNGEVNV